MTWHQQLLVSLRIGSLQITMYEKSCAIASQCGVSGQKYASGLYFNYTNICCDTDLCNGAAATFAAPSWGRLALILLPALALLLLAWASSRGDWREVGRKPARGRKKIFSVFHHQANSLSRKNKEWKKRIMRQLQKLSWCLLGTTSFKKKQKKCHVSILWCWLW